MTDTQKRTYYKLETGYFPTNKILQQETWKGEIFSLTELSTPGPIYKQSNITLCESAEREKVIKQLVRNTGKQF
jgi:hypothetical protein